MQDQLIHEKNNELNQIQNDLIEINKIIEQLDELIIKDKENLNSIEQSTSNVIEKEIIPAIDTLEYSYDHVAKTKHKYTILKIAGGTIIGGIIFGAVGFSFGLGLIPCTIGLGVGVASGGSLGYLSKHI